MKDILLREGLEKEIGRGKARRKTTRRLKDKYPVGSRVIPFEMPKYAKRIMAHLADCFVEHRCILCSDCVAFALSVIEKGVGVPFVKFLLSTLSNRYNPCPFNRMSEDDVFKFARYLLRLPREKRYALWDNLFCHTEFAPPMRR